MVFRNSTYSNRRAEIDDDFVKWQNVEARGNFTRLREASRRGERYALKHLARTPADLW